MLDLQQVVLSTVLSIAYGKVDRSRWYSYTKYQYRYARTLSQFLFNRVWFVVYYRALLGVYVKVTVQSVIACITYITIPTITFDRYGVEREHLSADSRQ